MYIYKSEQDWKGPFKEPISHLGNQTPKVISYQCVCPNHWAKRLPIFALRRHKDQFLVLVLCFHQALHQTGIYH